MKYVMQYNIANNNTVHYSTIEHNSMKYVMQYNIANNNTVHYSTIQYNSMKYVMQFNTVYVLLILLM